MAPRDDPRWFRLVVGGVLPVAFCSIAVIVPLATWSKLPNPMAVHFDGSGIPNGSMPTATSLLFGLAVTLAPSAWLVLTVLRARRQISGSRALPLAVFLGAAGAATSVLIVVANFGVADWRSAHNPSPGVAFVLGLPVLLTLGVYAAGRRISSG